MLIDVKVPVLAESVAEATLMSWQKRAGEQVKRGDNLIDIETDKVTLEVSALNDGVISEILKDDGEIVQSDEVIARIDTEASASDTAPAAKEAEPEQQSLPEMDAKTAPLSEEDLPKLSPAVRNLMEEHQLNASDISTTADRITKEDVLRHIDGENKSSSPVVESPAPVATPAPAPAEKVETKSAPPKQEAPVPVLTNSTGDRPEEKVPMTRLRKRVAERLLSAQHENAILTTFNEVNMQPVMDIRSRYKDEFEKTHGIKLGFMSFFTRVVVEALKKFPVINASVDGDNIIYMIATKQLRTKG